MRWFERVALALIALAVVAGPACAAERLALLIGNQSYNAKVGPLKNPHNDIALIGAALRSLKFKVTEIKDADYRSIDTAIKRHTQTVRREGQGAISFVYYSGHGAADPDTKINYLIPVDVANADDDDLWINSLNLNAVIEALRAQAPTATHYVVFDACRNELNLTQKGKRVLVDRGFVPIAYTPGVMIAYATSPGKTATDLGSGGAPYAKALAAEIVKPGVEAMTMFRRVALRVNREIGQDPWISASTLPEVYFAGEAAAAPVATPPPPPSPQPQLSEALQAWATVKDSIDIRDLEAYRRQYGAANPFYDRQAERRIEELKKQQVAVAAPPPAAKPAGPPQAKPAVQVTLAPTPAPGTVFRDCPDCPEMVVVPAGSFTIGSPPGEEGRESWKQGSESPQLKVEIARSFAVGKFSVTRGEFAAFVAATGHLTDGGCYAYTGEWKQQADRDWRSPGFSQNDHHSVVCVNWDDAKAYVAWLTRKTGKSYRLLSEAEREYVTRAGTKTPFWWGSSISTQQANYNGSATPYKGGSKGEYRRGTVSVDTFSANPWGLYNVHGNVWEWTEDCWNDSHAGNPGNGNPRTSGDCSGRVTRGGSWDTGPEYLRAADRVRNTTVQRVYDFGFRVGRTLAP